MQASTRPSEGSPDLDPARALAETWHHLPARVAARTLPYRASYGVIEDHVAVATNSPDVFAAIDAIWRRFAHNNGAAVPSGRRYYLVDLGAAGAPTPLARSLYAPCGADFIRSIRSRYLLMLGDEIVHQGDTAAAAVDYLQWMIAAQALAHATRYAVFHGAVLTYGCGDRGLMLPAASGSGKTTLAAALVAAGWGYLSDEAALVDPATLRVHAYPKPLDIKRPGLLPDLLPLPPTLAAEALARGDATWRLDAESLAPGCVRDETAIRAIVFPRYDADETTALTPLSGAAATLRLLRCGVNDAACPPRGLAVAAALAARARCYSLVIGALAPAVQLLEEVCRVEPFLFPGC